MVHHYEYSTINSHHKVLVNLQASRTGRCSGKKQVTFFKHKYNFLQITAKACIRNSLEWNGRRPVVGITSSQSAIFFHQKNKGAIFISKCIRVRVRLVWVVSCLSCS